MTSPGLAGIHGASLGFASLPAPPAGWLRLRIPACKLAPLAISLMVLLGACDRVAETLAPLTEAVERTVPGTAEEAPERPAGDEAVLAGAASEEAPLQFEPEEEELPVAKPGPDPRRRVWPPVTIPQGPPETTGVKWEGVSRKIKATVRYDEDESWDPND